MADPIVIGCIGGAIPEVVRIIKGKYDEMPDFLKHPIYYVAVALQIALGGFLVYILKTTDIKSALLTGYAGPEIITSLASAFAAKQGQTTTTPATAHLAEVEENLEVENLPKKKEFNLLGWFK